MVDAISIPEDLRRTAEEKGWPGPLLERALAARTPRDQIEIFLGQNMPVEMMQRMVEQRERLMCGTLRARNAGTFDAAELSECFANSPEHVGDWEVTVERSPRPFAQFRLQENASVQVLEDRGVILAAQVFSFRNSVVGGKPLVVAAGMATRVRAECRGQGFGDLVSFAPLGFRPPPPLAASVFSLRSHNVEAASFYEHRWQRVGRTLGPRNSKTQVPGIPVSVLGYPRRSFDGDSRGIRKARRSDLRRCVALINRTHAGLDLFRPYTGEYLKAALGEGLTEQKPAVWLDAHSIYGWEDYYVLEEDGRPVACAGLWDRGRDIREVWRHKTSGEEHTVTSADVMDFGFAEGREASMARLIAYLIGETDDRKRDTLNVPLEHLPRLVELLESYDPVAETRGLSWVVWDSLENRPIDLPLADIYTDLRYW